MKINRIFWTIIILALVLMLAACTSLSGTNDDSANVPSDASTDVPAAVSKVYQDFLEAAKTDLRKAHGEYCYYKSANIIELAVNSNDYVKDYTILEWEQLSDTLWTVKAIISTVNDEPRDVTNFVGMIDGEPKVMIAVNSIPDSLFEDAEGVDFSKYYPDGIDHFFPEE